MGKYLLGRLVQMIPVFLLVTFLSYSLVFLLPGDPIQAVVGTEAVDPELLKRLRHDLGFDQPVPVQYAMWLGRMVRGDLGRSLKRGTGPVTEELMRRLPITLQLTVAAWLFGVLISIPAGIISAVRRNSGLDIVATFFAVGGVAMPSFWLGIMLILLFGVVLRWLPPGGFVSIFTDPATSLRYLLLPAFTLGLAMMATTMRQIRSSMLEVMAEDYIRTARAKGLRERAVIGVHALKNSLLPVVTVMGMQVSRLLGGTVVIETIFAVPGMGRLSVDAVLTRDIPTIQGVVVFMAIIVLLANLVTDIIYGYLDPRIRYT